MSEEKKTKLIYSGELLIFAVVFFVLGLLILLNVIHLSDRWRRIFTWVTIFGSSYLIFDFLWSVLSKKRRKKVSLLDKCLSLPIGLFLIPIDIISFVTSFSKDYGYYKTVMVILFFYITVIYIFEAVYHYYHPIPGLLEEEDRHHYAGEESSSLPDDNEKEPQGESKENQEERTDDPSSDQKEAGN